MYPSTKFLILSSEYSNGWHDEVVECESVEEVLERWDGDDTVVAVVNITTSVQRVRATIEELDEAMKVLKQTESKKS